MPKAASATANAPGPPPVWSLTANGSSTSIGPMITSTSRIANSRVASSHLVRDHVGEPVADVDQRAATSGCRARSRSRRTAVVRIRASSGRGADLQQRDDRERDARRPDRDDHAGHRRARRPA